MRRPVPWFFSALRTKNPCSRGRMRCPMRWEGKSRFPSGNDNKREEVQREREDWEIPILHTGESEFRFATRRENRVLIAPRATGKTAQDGN